VDSVSLIVAALGATAAGVSSGLTDAAASAVKDAYEGLRGLVSRLFHGRPAAEAVLTEHAKDPEGPYKAPLAAELTRAGAGDDPQIVAAAQRVMATLDPAGAQAGKYMLDLRGAQVGQIGDHNTAAVTFNTPPLQSD
jgi:hypothetical protein